MPVKPIKFDDLERMGIDENNNLYWDNHRLKTVSEVKLEWWVNIAVVLGSIGSFGLSVIEFCKLLKG